MVLDSRMLSAFTVGEARVFLAPAAASRLLGAHARVLQGADDVLLVDALRAAAPDEQWSERLRSVRVDLLDVNRAADQDLRRIPGFDARLVEALLGARPYLDLEDLVAEHPDDRERLTAALRYLGHEGYDFVDVPRAHPVRLDVSGTGIVALASEGEEERVSDAVRDAGLAVLGTDPGESLVVGAWRIPPAERALQLRRLKESTTVATVGPIVQDPLGQTRIPHPFRLDVAVHQHAGTHAWSSLVGRYGLTLALPYAEGYGSLRVAAAPADLGALYRTMRRLAREDAVRIVEPTWLPFPTQ